jgi:hypothetical protein
MKMSFIATALVLLAIATVTPAFALTAADAEKAALAAYPGGKIDKGHSPPLIHTARGAGYRLAVDDPS